jgi:hypothetical protein
MPSSLAKLPLMRNVVISTVSQYDNNLCAYARPLLLRSAAVLGCEWIRPEQFYLFVWAGDGAKKSNDFRAVLDADPKSPHYGQAVASVAVPGPQWNASSRDL